MPNFPPLRNYVHLVVDRWIARHGLKPPFLDVGCGTGALARHLAGRGWNGAALDSSPAAAEESRRRLRGQAAVEVIEGGLDRAAGRQFETIFIMDVLEHVRDDGAVLKALSGMLSPSGAVVLLLPVNPREWRHDDVLYGHFRRYGWDEIAEKLSAAGLEVEETWNVTMPFMWAFRRVYLRFLPSRTAADPRDTLTAASSFYNPWNENPLLAGLGFVLGLPLWWRALFRIQDRFAGSRRGHAAMFLARRAR